ncbi:MAG: hypothetical protein HPY53_03505 [Brevinematales bacterium]|nr:hypothetical protein [Brevinematales bacterium]
MNKALFFILLLIPVFLFPKVTKVTIRNGSGYGIAELYIVPSKGFKGKWGKDLMKNKSKWEYSDFAGHEVTVKYTAKDGALYHVKFKDFYNDWGELESVDLSKHNPLIFKMHAAYNTNYIPKNPGLGYFEKNPWGIKYDNSKDTLKPYHSKLEIYNYFLKLPRSALENEIFVENAVYFYVDDYKMNAGTLPAKSLNQGLVWLNYLRWLAGVNSDIQYTDKLNNIAQHGAFILAANTGDGITVHPKKPYGVTDEQFELGYEACSHANIAEGCGLSSFPAALRLWIGYVNACTSSTVGDREWIISPSLGNVGFGFNGSFALLYLGDVPNPNPKFEQKAICWPAPGHFPNEFLAGYKSGEPWTVTVNPKYYKTPDINKVTVKMTRLIDNTVIVLDVSHNKASACGPYLNVKLNVGGMPNSIMFRPDYSLANYSDGQVYRVEISGLEDLSGNPAEMSYTVEFFNLQ